MDRVMEKFFDGVRDLLGPESFRQLDAVVPTEMQGYAGILRGAFARADGSLFAVRLTTVPWDTDERWTVMVQGRALGRQQFWEWFADDPLCRVPFVVGEFHAHCQNCGDVPCVHAAILTHHWLVRVQEVPRFLLLFLNRRGKNHHTNVNMQPIVRVPVVLGTNLDRTRRELAAILEAVFKAAGDDRDNLFGGDMPAHLGERP